MRFLNAFYISLMLLVASLAPATTAHAETMTWQFNNNTADQIQLRFHNEDRSLVWPDNDEHFILEPFDSGSVTLTCNYVGEKICYGAKASDDSGTWGIGYKGNKGCNNCCFTCSTTSEPTPMDLNP